eukprot:517010-Pleurochrysis_carterae.AAC.3
MHARTHVSRRTHARTRAQHTRACAKLHASVCASVWVSVSAEVTSMKGAEPAQGSALARACSLSVEDDRSAS